MLYTIFTVLPFMVCLFWTAVYLLDWHRQYPAKHMLTIFMAVCTVLYLCHALYFNKIQSYLPVVDCIYALCNLTVFPLYYLYICRLSEDKVNHRRHVLLFTPAMLITLWAVGIYCLSGPDFVHQTARITVMRIVFILQVLYVCFYGYKTLRRFDESIENFYSDTSLRETKQTRYMMGALLICAISSAFVNILGRDYFIENHTLIAIPAVLFGVILFGIGYVGDRQRFSIDDMIADIGQNDAGEASFITDDVKVTEESASQINTSLGDEIARLIETKKLYLNHDIKLTDLAMELGVGRTLLSSTINQAFGMSYSDYINSFRVRHALNLLCQNANLSMELIAEEAGFSNATTFYRAFKKQMGTTPKNWLKTHKNTQENT